MRRLAFVASLAVLAVTGSPAMAAEFDGLALASRLPVEVSEVVSGGTWIDGQASGTYRTITIQNTVPVEAAEVYLQWIGARTPADPLQIMSSVPLREFNEQNLASASITLETEREGEVRIIIAGQDGDARPVELLTFLATTPGLYKRVPPEVVTGAGVRN